MVLLLPTFLTYSGLNTRIGMVNAVPLLLIALGMLVALIFAKGVACYGAVRLPGEDKRTPLGIGALMKFTRPGGTHYHQHRPAKGIIGTTLLSMLVLMAIATTMMASPLFEVVQGRKPRETGKFGALDPNNPATPIRA